jgi:hypothetical protein
VAETSQGGRGTGTDVDAVPYDLDRAARAGGFDDDPEMGREVARRLHATLRRLTDSAEPHTAKDVVTETIHDIADLWEGDATGNSMWLAAISNTLNAMLADLSQQIRDARGLRRRQPEPPWGWSYLDQYRKPVVADDVEGGGE